MDSRHSEISIIRYARFFTNERKELHKKIDGDLFTACVDWQPGVFERWVAPWWSHDDRFHLVKNLLGTGMPPLLFVQWAVAQPGVLGEQGSVADLEKLMGAWKRGELDKYQVTTRKHGAIVTQPVCAPNFLSEFTSRRIEASIYGPAFYMPPGCEFFNEAMHILASYKQSLPRDGQHQIQWMRDFSLPKKDRDELYQVRLVCHQNILNPPPVAQQ